jgi:hypothetical protein
MLVSVVSVRVPDGHPVVEMPVMIDGGPLVVAGVYDFGQNQVAPGLLTIYMKAGGFKIGPYYAELSKAHAGMRKILKEFPAPYWAQPVEWLKRQKKMLDWLDLHLGKPKDLIGADWRPD